MVRRLMAQFWLVLASLAAAAAGAPALAAQAPQRIVAVGDLHGDWEAWIAIARAAGLVDARNRWAGGRTTLVQLGDIADRGPDSLRIVNHLRQLRRAAQRKGGNVIVLVGNHEAMNVTGDLRYVHPGEYAAFADRNSEARRETYYERIRKGVEFVYRAEFPEASDDQIRETWIKETPLGMLEHRVAWGPDGEIGRWVRSNPAVVKIGDTLFAHGGLSAEIAAVPIDEINRRVAAALAAGEQGLDSIINSPLGPLWYRGNVTRGGSAGEEIALAAGGSSTPSAQRPSIEEELDSVLTAYGARRLVVGHTPNLQGIAVTQGGKLVRIDTGIARHYGGRLSYLEILGDRLVPHTLERPSGGEGAGS